jgi:sortase A
MLTLAGVLFIIAGGLFLYPILRDQLRPIPVAFGEARPLLRPTVTPVPANHRETVPLPTPEVLPETPLLAPNQTVPPLLAAVPEITDSLANIPTRIVIPAIGLAAPIEIAGWRQVDGVSTWEIPERFAAGWLKSSASLGKAGNTVLDGHHNRSGEVFRHLVDLKPGDLIEVYSQDQRFPYTVTTLHILPDRDQPIEIRRRNAIWIQPTLDERLTLVTCWPYTNNTHRLIVVAKPLSAAPAR